MRVLYQTKTCSESTKPTDLSLIKNTDRNQKWQFTHHAFDTNSWPQEAHVNKPLLHSGATPYNPHLRKPMRYILSPNRNTETSKPQAEKHQNTQKLQTL